MSTRWNPRDVLDVDTMSDKFTCTGITQRGVRCRNRVNIQDRMEAAALLREIATLRPNSAACIRMLDELASLTLCKRWHRGPQNRSTCSKWVETIDSYLSTATTMGIEAPIPRQRFPLEYSVAELHPAVSTSRSSPRVTIQPSPPITSQPPSTPSPPRVVRSDINIQIANLLLEQIRRTTIPIPPRAEPSAIPTPPPEPPRQTTQAAEPALVSSPPPEPSPRPTPPPSQHRPQNHAPQVVRRAITDPCPICYEEICCTYSAVWCRGQCGHNVHISCFAEWRTNVLSQNASRMDEEEGNGVTCVMCRAPWVENEPEGHGHE